MSYTVAYHIITCKKR